LVWKVQVLGGPSLKKGESTPVRGGSPPVVVPKILMCVLMEELLCQGLMGRELALECFSVRCMCVSVVTSFLARP
jgi:hypothetical protein